MCQPAKKEVQWPGLDFQAPSFLEELSESLTQPFFRPNMADLFWLTHFVGYVATGPWLSLRGPAGRSSANIPFYGSCGLRSHVRT